MTVWQWLWAVDGRVCVRDREREREREIEWVLAVTVWMACAVKCHHGDRSCLRRLEADLGLTLTWGGPFLPPHLSVFSPNPPNPPLLCQRAWAPQGGGGPLPVKWRSPRPPHALSHTHVHTGKPPHRPPVPQAHIGRRGRKIPDAVRIIRFSL